MLREGTLEDISDGRKYSLNDMVKTDTGNCENCHKCCTGMGNSIVLDPFDVWQLKKHLGISFQDMLSQQMLELNMVDGLILPNLCMKMVGKLDAKTEQCSFLNEEGRCSIHVARPGICRIFPLGRVYEDGSFSYFLQKGQCAKENLSKIKVKKWIDTANIMENQKFILAWHQFIRKTGDKNLALREKGMGDKINEVAMFVLNIFFVDDFDANIDTIYQVLEEKIDYASKQIAIIN